MLSIKNKRNPEAAFSLLELLLVIALIALLASLLMPAFENMRFRSESAACANNLREIGLGMLQVVQENNNTFPKVETDPSNPIYTPADHAKTLLETLSPYGVTAGTLRCPADARHDNYFARNGTSYDWFPLVDGEIVVSPQIYTQSGTLDAPLSLIPMAADFTSVHRGKKNLLFGDGHVRSY